MFRRWDQPEAEGPATERRSIHVSVGSFSGTRSQRNRDRGLTLAQGFPATALPPSPFDPPQTTSLTSQDYKTTTNKLVPLPLPLDQQQKTAKQHHFSPKEFGPSPPPPPPPCFPPFSPRLDVSTTSARQAAAPELPVLRLEAALSSVPLEKLDPKRRRNVASAAPRGTASAFRAVSLL